MTDEQEEVAAEQEAAPEEPGTPDYDEMVKEYGDPFDGADPIPPPTYSDLFESHEPLKITDEDVEVRMPKTEELDTSFLNVTLQDVLDEARGRREKKTETTEPEVEESRTGQNGPRPNRRQRRAAQKGRLVTS